MESFILNYRLTNIAAGFSTVEIKLQYDDKILSLIKIFGTMMAASTIFARSEKPKEFKPAVKFRSLASGDYYTELWYGTLVKGLHRKYCLSRRTAEYSSLSMNNNGFSFLILYQWFNYNFRPDSTANPLLESHEEDVTNGEIYT